MDNRIPLTETAETEFECLQKITQKYGTNFHVLRKKQVKIKTGFLNLFETDGFELTFYLNSESMKNNKVQNLLEVIDRKAPLQNIVDNQTTSSNKQNSFNLPTEQFDQVIQKLKSMEEIFLENKSTRIEEYPSILKITSFLEENEFSASYIRKIISMIKKELTIEKLNDFNIVKEFVVKKIVESIRIAKPNYAKKPQIILLVGPTGVGKTTTVAKLAAKFAFSSSESKKVRIITVDWFRIGAKEQIEIYANILQIPLFVAESNKELLDKLDSYKADVDYVIIDTTGYSSKEFNEIDKMRKTLEINDYAVEPYLCVSATTKTSDLCQIIYQYEIFNYTSLIITKFDETKHIGNVICALNEKNKSVTYITTGQKVPSDIKEVSLDHFVELLSNSDIKNDKLQETFQIK